MIRIYSVECKVNSIVPTGTCYIVVNKRAGIPMSKFDMTAFFCSEGQLVDMMDNPGAFIKTVNEMLTP